MFIDHRYEVLESLGSGTWANVYKVRDIRTDNLFTLKLFQYLPSEVLYSHFSAEEMHHITKIEHPNLSHVVDFGHVGDHVYFISEFFEGKTLNNFRFNKSKCSVIYDIVVQICYALHALHTQDILHKDLKLENVLYRMEGKTVILKLIDYGFSKNDQTKDNRLVAGTLPYLAPEIYLGKAATKASDFYALGVMLYRLTTGSFPFSLDQINALITGSQQYFIPNFPSELNKDIPLALENFILRLLERNPDNRFNNAEEIINYINRILQADYTFSTEWSMINTLRFNSYLIREKYSHQLLDFIPAMENSNGKIISVIGGDGLGKDNILSLFRYHLLSGQYFIFDYSCTRTDHEAFFALIKEFVQSLSPDEIEQYASLKSISEKFRRYLFTGEKEAKDVRQTPNELKIDFDSVKSLLIDLSILRPIIFIIRNFQHVHRHTVDFINFISPYIIKHRIMVAVTCNDFNKANQIDHTVMINIPNLSMNESKAYVNRLLSAETPPAIVNEIFTRSAGNPHFIREILIDLTQRKKIYFETAVKFPPELGDYQLPARLLHSIYSRMSHLTSINYSHLQKLSSVQTPLTRDLILYILKISDSELYSLLNDSTYNEILNKRGKNYYFSFEEAKQRLHDESSAKSHVLVSKRVLKFYSNKEIMDVVTCRGLIQNSYLANDLLAARHYYLKLYNLLNIEYEQEQAYDAILNVLKLDFHAQVEVPLKDIISDIYAFHEKTEITGYFENADFVLKGINPDPALTATETIGTKVDLPANKCFPEIFEKYLLMGTIKFLAEDNAGALELFKKAEALTQTGRQQLLVWLYYTQIYTKLDLPIMKQYIDKAMAQNMPLEFKIAFVDRLAVYYARSKDLDRAIKTIEDFLANLPPEHDTRVMIRLAAMHNDLGVFYSDQKNIEEADEHLNVALSIWKRYNIKRYLGLIYNNISDLYLKQGITILAEHYSDIGYAYADELNLTLTKALALLNQGEARIKMGDFITAEEKLLECKELVLSKNSTTYLLSVQRNLALAKSKIKGFGHYFKFIQENEPELIEGRIREITPLVKTYFYYLNEMSNAKKLKKMITKNVQINYKHIHEEEFHHNVLSLIALSESDYDTALQELKLAMRHAGEINNNYAVAVFYVLQISCYYGMQDIQRAKELMELALPIIKQNRYRYWQCKLEVLDLKLDLLLEEIPLRGILRRAETCHKNWREYEYYQLNVELYQIKLQILSELKQEQLFNVVYSDYCKYMDVITTDISMDDRQNFLQVNLVNDVNLSNFDLLPIASRAKDLRHKWNEMLYNIANVNNLERIKFLIEKGLCQVLAPWQFKLMQYSERIQNYTCFQSYNADKDGLISAEILPYIDKAFKLDSLVLLDNSGLHEMIVPLQSGTKRIGFLLLTDNGEMEYTKQELSIMRNVKQHLTALIIRIHDYGQITQRIEKMNHLMQITHELMRIVDIADLEHEIVSACIDFTFSSRGFLIKRDSDGNNIYRVQLNQAKQLLPTISGVSKTVLSLSQNTLEMVSTFNAVEDNRFKSAISVQDYALHTIFCAPIIVENAIFGYIYLDNLDDNGREMYLNQEIIKLLMEQITIALKNAMLYDNLLKKNSELNAFEMLKDEFMAIVSHELNTPLTTLQGYVSRLKRNLYADEEERKDIITKIENSVKKLILTSNDITTMNSYNLKKSLTLSYLPLNEILELIQQEVEILSRNRKMFIRTEIEKDLPKVKANWEALHLMIYNLVLNAIRFTNDYGTVTIGARRSAFQQEKIDGKESIVIFVQDNGIGMPDYQLKNVFRKFYELNEIYAHKSGTVEYRSSGLGLGLATSKRIAELHGGNIWLKSKENEGTTVFVTIPLKS
ncbi:MAG: ATP-binding protein [Candidatus Cloacimonetes bacterium]|nr:ATP-binding protein [Candidatus Cloacimonadota bacterium]